ncbi:MAG: iron-containing alcohol dehydrogenase [Clostridiales bacterium]|nr:iron-containing alcohol dehydrogenase [Clostridiales bacterium]
MAGGRYIKYARKNETEPQSIYLESGSAYKVVDELKRLGTRRILLICDKYVRRYKNFEDLTAAYAEAGFRLFYYYRNGHTVSDLDIREGLRVYNEFNCDTIVTAGGAEDINCGKLVAASAINPVKHPTEFEGVDKLKRDISVLCCIVTDNSEACSSSIAEFRDTASGRWITCVSSFLVPQIAVIDTDFSIRTEPAICESTALQSLASAIEAYLSPMAGVTPQYKADALNSCINIFDNVEKMSNNPSDTYLRRICSVGGMYAGLAMRKTGLGEAHILMHCLASKYRTDHAAGLNRIFPRFLRAQIATHPTGDYASLAKELHMCTLNLDDRDAAQVLADRVDRLFSRYRDIAEIPVITEADAKKIAAEADKEASVFGITGQLPQEEMAKILYGASLEAQSEMNRR